MTSKRINKSGWGTGEGQRQRIFLYALAVTAIAATNVACRDGSTAVVAKASTLPDSGMAQVTVVNPDALADLLDASRGDILVVNFWATWCKPCLEEMPELANFYETEARDAKGIRFLSVSANAPVNLKESVGPYLVKNEIPFPVYVIDADSPDELVETLDLAEAEWDGSLPATFLFDESGSLRKVWLSEVTRDELQTTVERLRSQAA
jgi:thiol-disulfide isomerase/thioredoxin